MANQITGFQVNATGSTPTVASLAQQAVATPTAFQPPQNNASGARAPAGKAPIFRYPLENILEDYSDYLKIDAYKYEPPGVGALSADNFAIPTSDTNYRSLSTKTVEGTVILPVPQSIPNNSQSANWQSGSLTPLNASLLGSAENILNSQSFINQVPKEIGAFINKFTQAAQTGNGQSAFRNFFSAKAVEQLTGQADLFGEVLARETGAIINENVELLFRGVNLRSPIELSFDLAPRDEKEAQEIKKMVFFLKKQMSPNKGTESGAAGGIFIMAPNIFKVQYMSGKKEHPFLNRYKMCALQNLNFNFSASNTHATYADGTPVHMNLSLTFQELTPIYAEDYESPEGKMGVGY
jgi:hypothetical protein